MEHTCYRCGQPVEEGVAFCENCKAPQIRVSMPSENEGATEPMVPGTPEEIQPPARPVGLSGNESRVRPASLSWHEAVPGAAMAGIVIALVLVIPFAAYLLWPIAAGVLGVMLYRRRNPGVELGPAAGARLGAVAGLFAFLVFSILMGAELAAMSGSGKLRDSMLQALQQSAARNPGPEAQELVQRLMTPQGIALMLVLVFIMFLVLFVGLSSVGGVLGVKLMNRRTRR